MIRALAAVLLLSACASAPPEALPPDTLAFEVPQHTIASLLLRPFDEAALNSDEPVFDVNPPITAHCRDNWVSYSRHRSGTCSGHRGVRQWVNRPAD